MTPLRPRNASPSSHCCSGGDSNHRPRASRGDDARGSAIVILATMAATAGGTAVVAPFIGHGLVPLASATFVLEVAALACLVLLPRLQEMA
jgi:hypothetical protein